MMQSKKRQFWDKINEYEYKLYGAETLAKLLTVAVRKLNQAGEEPTFENVSILVFRLFPEKFSLTKWREYPDLIRIDNTLRLDCHHSDYVKGNRVHGYKLHQKGKDIADELIKIFESGKPRGRRRVISIDKKNRATRLIGEVNNSEAFHKFQDDKQKEIRNYEICDVLHGTTNSKETELRRNLNLLIEYADLLKSNKEYKKTAASVLKFLKFVDSNLEDLLND